MQPYFAPLVFRSVSLEVVGVPVALLVDVRSARAVDVPWGVRVEPRFSVAGFRRVGCGVKCDELCVS
eukprot:m.519460 g.519460  ORF g.519460 m.519460 type:complete len:67 (-) comp21945_c0_seq9:2091-2291(-)